MGRIVRGIWGFWGVRLGNDGGIFLFFFFFSFSGRSCGGCLGQGGVFLIFFSVGFCKAFWGPGIGRVVFALRSVEIFFSGKFQLR